MDWLKKAAGWVGNALYQGARYLPGAGNVIRSYEDAARETERARQQALQKLQQQNRQAPQQLRTPVQPKLNYNAALAAIKNLPGVASNVSDSVALNTIKLAKQGVNTAQATQMRLNALGKTIGGQKVDQNYWNRINQLERDGFVPRSIREGRATPGEFTAQTFKTGVPVGLELAPFFGGSTAGVTKMGIKQAAPKILKEGLVYGGTKGAYTLGFGEGKLEDRAKQAAIDVAMGPLYEALGYGVGRVGGAVVGRIKGKPTPGVRIDPKTGKKVFAPTYNLGGGKKIAGVGQLGDDFTSKTRVPVGKIKNANGKYLETGPVSFENAKAIRLGSGATGELDETRVVKYMRDIQNGKKIEPLVISYKKNAQGQWEALLEDGKHRLTALQRLGINEVPVVDEANIVAAKQAAKGQIRALEGGITKNTRLYHGTNAQFDGNLLGNGSYVTPDAAAAKQFGQVAEVRLSRDLKPKEVLQVNSQAELDKLFKDANKWAIKNGGKATGMDAISEYAKSKGYKAIQGSDNLDSLAGINVLDPKLLKPAGKKLGKLNPSLYADDAIGNDVPKSVMNQIDGATPKLKMKQRGFVKSLGEDLTFPRDVTEGLPQAYRPITNAKTYAAAQRAVKDPDALGKFLSKPKGEITAVDQAQGQILLRRAIDVDDFATAERIATKIDVNAREAGRTVQVLAAWKKTTPEGALSQAYKVVDEANAQLPKSKQVSVTPEKARAIRTLAEKAQTLAPGTRERDVANALIQKEITSIVPPTLGRKLSTIQTMAQLLNPKTAIRNVGGNAVFAGAENVSGGVATPVDWLISKFTGRRTVALPSLKTQLQGFAKGAKYGVEDTKLGIRTSGASGQFEIRPDVFKNKVLKTLEHAVGYELSVPDKAFYQAAFDDSMRSQMKAMKLSKPTQEIIAQANDEALYKTFQGNSSLANALSKVKRGLNAGQDFGLGEMVLKYPKTPGNIVSAGLDYSGGGVIKGINGLVRGIRSGELSASQQRQAALEIGRGLTGLGILGAGAAAAQGGIATGNTEKDKDVRGLLKQAGNGQYTFNITGAGRLLQGGDTKPQQGDVYVNYDWIQPLAVPLSIGVNSASPDAPQNRAANTADSINAGINTIVEQPVLQGLKRLFSGVTSGNVGDGLVGTITDTLKNAPSSFIPSLLNQAGQVQDPYSRNTYDPDPFQESANMIRNRIPGLRQTLPQRLDAFGQPQQLYEDNNAFNVFLNPAFVKHYNLTPEAKLVLDVNTNSGETKQFPRVADYKVEVNGQKRQLTADEYYAFQKYTGEKTKDAFSRMQADPKFMALSDKDKADRMSQVMSDIGAAAKIEILGDQPDKPDKNVKNILNTGSAKYKYGKDESSSPTNPRERYEQELEQFRQDTADGKVSDIQRIKRQDSLNKLSVQANYSQDIVDLYGLSKEKMDGYLKGAKNGQGLLDQLIKLDDALVAAGYSSKLRDKYGNISITPKPKKIRVGGGRKYKTRMPRLRTASGSVSRVRAKAAPKIKFAKAPSKRKTAKIRIG